jgi:hypothetical protein
MTVVRSYQLGNGQIPFVLTIGNRPSIRYPGRGRRCKRTHEASCPKSKEAWRRILRKCGGISPPALPGMLFRCIRSLSEYPDLIISHQHLMGRNIEHGSQITLLQLRLLQGHR